MVSISVLITFIIWLTLTVIFALFGMVVLDWQKYRRLAKYGVAIEGRVIAKEPDNHQFIRYSYSVGQQSYSGLGNAGRGNPAFERLNIGDSVKVFYDPDDPKVSFLGDPKDQSESNTRGVLFFTLLGPLFSIIGMH